MVIDSKSIHYTIDDEINILERLSRKTGKE